MNVDTRTLGLALAGLSVALGVVELVAARPIARRLGVPKRSGVVRGYGVRELATGAALLGRPTSATAVWARVAGDVLDLGSLGAASRADTANRKAIIAGVAFVAGALLLDVLSALKMQEEG